MLFHDFETYCEINLKEVGAAKYARHPSCEVLMLAYAFDDGPVQQWVPAEGEPMPAELRDAMLDPYVLKSAWNVPFEWSIWSCVLGLRTPHHAWRDAMVRALACSLPGGLLAASGALGLDADKAKDAAGKRLIKEFCVPRRPTKGKSWIRNTHVEEPEKWDEFKTYNRQDVIAERAITKQLMPFDLPPNEWALWCIDQEINENGLPINMRVVKNAIEVTKHVIESRLFEMKEITKLENPNSGTQLLPWLKNQGYPFFDLKKGHVSRALDRALEHEYDDDYQRILQLRSEVSKAAVKKYNALNKAVTDDGLLRYSLQFCAAGRTWRWGGRIFQPQNLARPAFYLKNKLEECVKHLEILEPWWIEQLYDMPMDLLSSCVRPVVQAPPGYLLIDADLNAIENRGLGWAAEDKKILSVFLENKDPYIDFASKMYHISYDVLMAEYKSGDKRKREISKPAVLGCGYQLSAGEMHENPDTGEIEATGLLGYALNMGIKLDLDQAVTSVKVWRETFKDAVAFWKDIEYAAKRCVQTGKRTRCNSVLFEMKPPFLLMRLPSGRSLHYKDPKILMKETPWGSQKMTLTYMGLDIRNNWVRIKTHGGKLTENYVQAISRDILANGIRLAKREGLDIRLHVHDQIIGLSKKDRAEDELKILLQCMREEVYGYKNFPLAANGHISRVFLKD